MKPSRAPSKIALALNPLPRLASQSKGKPNRRIIVAIRVGNRDHYLHATKGWRSYPA